MARSKLQQIERLEKELAGIASERADISKKIASKSADLAAKRRRLEAERRREQDRASRAQQQREGQLQRQIAQLSAQAAELRSQVVSFPDSKAILAETYVLESETAMAQGTCFNLASVGLVTCAHVLCPGLYLLSASDPTKRYPVEVVSKNETIDLAVVRAPGLGVGEGLPVGSADGLEQMDKVVVAGFPNYRLGDSGNVAVGSVTGFRMVSGIRRILVDTPIVGGNSGGPVLDAHGRVVGVAVTGADRMEDAGETEYHGVVPIDTVALLAAGA
jgi:S1-C subfamily serine protease